MKVLQLYYGNHRDSGTFEKMAKSEKSVLEVMQSDEYFHNDVIAIQEIDYSNKTITYLYDDTGDIEEDKISFDVFEVI